MSLSQDALTNFLLTMARHVGESDMEACAAVAGIATDYYQEHHSPYLLALFRLLTPPLFCLQHEVSLDTDKEKNIIGATLGCAIACEAGELSWQFRGEGPNELILQSYEWRPRGSAPVVYGGPPRP